MHRIEVKEQLDDDDLAAVTSLLDAATAAEYVAAGDYRWNAGMFVASAAVLLEQLRIHRPALSAGLSTIADAWDGPDQIAVLARSWPTLDRVAIDYAVAEPAAAAGRVAVVPAALGWDDIGDWASLASLLAGQGQVRILGDARLVLGPDSGGLIVPGGERLVAVLGLDDVVVVDTPDALLVTSLRHAQGVKQIVDDLKRTGRDDLT